MSARPSSSSSSAALVPQTLDRESLSTTGKAVTWWTAIMILARAAFVVFPLVYIFGADDWKTSIWFIIYAIIFFFNLVFNLTVFCMAVGRGDEKTKIFGDKIVSWNPLRRFYNIFFISVIDWGTNMALWVVWLTRNPEYVNHPGNNSTPAVNASGYFPFQMLCGAFIFTSVVYFLFAYQLVRSLWSQKQALTIRADSVNTQADKSAVGQFSVRGSKDLVNINLRGGASKVSTNRGVVQAYLAFGGIYHILMLVILPFFFAQLFHSKKIMRYDVFTGFLYAALVFWLALLFTYYVGGWKGDSVRKLVLESEANNDTVTAETNAELDSEMSSFFVFGFFFFFFNIIFAIYAYSLTGPNSLDWSTVPQFDPLALIQAPFFYVWLTLSSLNTGALVFFCWQAVVFVFIGGWNMYPDEDDNEMKSIDFSNVPVERGRANYLSIGLVAFLFAIWLVFYGFIIEAMIGGHWFAKYIFPITLSFAIIFFIAIVATVIIAYQRISDLEEFTYATRMDRLWLINRDWHLSMYRNVVAIFVAFVLQVVILSVTISQYFEPQRSSPWECILPPSSTSVPPYSSCNVYWEAVILAMFCTMWVYLICIIYSFSTLTIRVQIVKQVSRAVMKGK